MPVHVGMSLGLLERAVLEALDACGATPGNPPVKSAVVLDAVDARYGIGPRLGYETLIHLAVPWVAPVPLVVPTGNFGSREMPPAGERYTLASLSSAGVLALQGER